jgi:FkbM family methyltransferase
LKALPSYSQAGEDQIVRYLFNVLGITRPTYLEIGTNHPFLGNNTYYFYLRGSKGVCVEPDEAFFSLIRKYRGRDTLIQAGIGTEPGKEIDLYIFPKAYGGWNTFSQEEAVNRGKESGIAYTSVRKVPVMTINEVIGKYFTPHPNFISLDVEGLDLAILRSMDFDRYKPEVICVETITFSTQMKEEKISEIMEFLNEKGYFSFGDTHINTVFCRKDVYKGA